MDADVLWWEDCAHCTCAATWHAPSTTGKAPCAGNQFGGCPTGCLDFVKRQPNPFTQAVGVDDGDQ